jgi:hypothetical protein
LPDKSGRRRAVIVAVAAILIVSLAIPEAIVARDPRGLQRFMDAIGKVESGGRYHARNSTTGAYGKYQIMPANWKAWARVYLGNVNARPTPRNQERVARAKFRELRRWLDSWRNVAHWWLTGSGDRNPSHWSTSSRRYVKRVMDLYGGSRRPTPRHHRSVRSIQDTSARITYRGGWSKASYRGYAGDAVRYATRPGASATLTFTGRSIRWVGPVGPTRGRARIYVDGKLVRTVNLQARAFRARTTLFSRDWSRSGRHTVRIVVRTGGRPVAIDEFRIR